VIEMTMTFPVRDAIEVAFRDEVFRWRKEACVADACAEEVPL
jgi:hypothetical protein